MFKKIPIRIKFLTFVCILYVISYIFWPTDTKLAFGNFFSSLIKVLPILLLVFFVMFLGYIFLKPQIVKKHLGEDAGLKGWIVALVGSVLFSGPQYVIFPLLKELKEHGMKNSLIAVFLNNRNVQPAFLPVMAYYFGIKFTVIFAILVLLYALLSGILIGYLVKE